MSRCVSCLFVVILAVSCSGGGGETRNDIMTSASSPEALEVIALLNDQRMMRGLVRLRQDAALTDAATDHSAYMARTRILSHEGSGGSDFAERATAAGYMGFANGENVAEGYPDARRVFAGWMNSPGHRDNMLNPEANDIGVGVVIGPHDGKRWWTMVLGQR